MDNNFFHFLGHLEDKTRATNIPSAFNVDCNTRVFSCISTVEYHVLTIITYDQNQKEGCITFGSMKIEG